MFFVVLIKSSFFSPWTFSSQITSPLYSSRLFLLIVIELLFYVQISTSLGYTSKIKPAFPASAPEITFTLCPFLNRFAKCSRGSSKSSPNKPLFLHFIIATLSLISTIFPKCFANYPAIISTSSPFLKIVVVEKIFFSCSIDEIRFPSVNGSTSMGK